MPEMGVEKIVPTDSFVSLLNFFMRAVILN